jgi:hypothetical protein
MELSEAALAYAARGWAVFPLFGVVLAAENSGRCEFNVSRCRCGRPGCSRPGKHPLLAHGLNDASTDPAVISAWWERWPWANIGLATGARSGFVAIDVDRPTGETSLRVLQAKVGELPPTLQAVTGGGGLHILFAHTGGLRNSTGRLPGCPGELPNIDLRADGGALVAPPSMHVSGHRYRWVDPSASLAPAPSWLRDPPRPAAMVVPPHPGPGRNSGYGLAALRAELAKLLQAEGGGRNHALNRAAFFLGMLVGGGELHEDLVHDELVRGAGAIGLSGYESGRTVESGLREGMRRPRVAPHRQAR